MSDDLTPEQLDGMDMWDRDVMIDERHRASGSFLIRRAVREIRRHRRNIVKLKQWQDGETRCSADLDAILDDLVKETP